MDFNSTTEGNSPRRSTLSDAPEPACNKNTRNAVTLDGLWATHLPGRTHLPDMLSTNNEDPNAGKRPYPPETEETTQEHPNNEDMDIIDDPDPDAGKHPYPDDVKPTGDGE